jgi:PPM family protein phosphatase
MTPSGQGVVQVSAATHPGCVRSGNEDALLVDSWIGVGEQASCHSEHDLSRKELVLAVADGLGGHQAGEVASRFVIEQMAGLPPGSLREPDAAAAALNAINARLTDHMLAEPSLLGMGSTLVGAVLGQGHGAFFNVGDSRAYVFDGQSLTQLSVDDTPLAPAGGGGSFPRRSHLVTQVFGGSLSRDQLGPHFRRHDLLPGSKLLLCSDGLTDMLEVGAIADLIRRPDVEADSLLRAALDVGGEDNISVILVTIPRGFTTAVS